MERRAEVKGDFSRQAVSVAVDRRKVSRYDTADTAPVLRRVQTRGVLPYYLLMGVSE